jgi:predicted O-linked N-acetylglucosamine transferase (SPINDLY family)
VFCCFNQHYKITPDIFDIWMRLLRQVEGSVLWLLDGDPAALANLRHEAESRGVGARRLVFAPRTNQEIHLARHRLADLFIDTMPYNAHTTASDALWTGLPLVTCTGGSFASRVATSLLKAVGLAELAAASLDDYEKLALRLATDRPMLAAIAARLTVQRQTYGLFDTARFCRDIENAYETMCGRHRRGKAPESFAVDAGPRSPIR